MPMIIRPFALSLALCLGVAAARAQEIDRQQMKGLDEQVQDIKSDVLSIAAELNLLEEKLLYPSGTQVAVFVALVQGDTVRLDAVQIQIDGEPVAHYIYSSRSWRRCAKAASAHLCRQR
jgi:nitrous oxidase accessory protein NosD